MRIDAQPGAEDTSDRPAAARDSTDGKQVLSASGPPGPPRTRWAWIVATFGGIGLLKPGPGTYGSIAATGIWWLVSRSVPYTALPWVTAGMAVAATLFGIPAAPRVARESGRKAPQMVGIEEGGGRWLALLVALPTVPCALLALLLFRIFDILKPPPIRRLERLPEGIGIVVDDLAAGMYALLLGGFLVQPLLEAVASHAIRR